MPARVGFADVKNHLTTPALRERMGSDLFVYHGYTELFLEGKWVKATPAFNVELCRRFKVKPLEFDGREDSIFHAFDEDDRRHMEYLRDRGCYADVPAAEIMRVFREVYPALCRPGGCRQGEFRLTPRELLEQASAPPSPRPDPLEIVPASPAQTAGRRHAGAAAGKARPSMAPRSRATGPRTSPPASRSTRYGHALTLERIAGPGHPGRRCRRAGRARDAGCGARIKSADLLLTLISGGGSACCRCPWTA